MPATRAGFQRATRHTEHATPHTPHHTETETEKEDREREDKMKNKMKEKKTEIMMWTDAESKFAQEKAKQAG